MAPFTPRARLALGPHPPLKYDGRLMQLLALDFRQLITMNPTFTIEVDCVTLLSVYRGSNGRFMSRGIPRVIDIGCESILTLFSSTSAGHEGRIVGVDSSGNRRATGPVRIAVFDRSRTDGV